MKEEVFDESHGVNRSYIARYDMRGECRSLDESGKGWRGRGDRRYYRSYNYVREHQQEYRQGNCKVERKWERAGGYKQETKCKGYR